MNWLKLSQVKVSLIILGLIIIGVASYAGIKQYRNYKAKMTKDAMKQQQKDKENQDLFAAQHKALDDTKQAIENLKAENQAQQDKLSTTEHITQKKLSDLQKSTSQTKPDLATIIQTWRPKIAYIECHNLWADGTLYSTQSGSGLIIKAANGLILTYTNKHVISNQFGNAPNDCSIKLPGDNNTYNITLETVNNPSGVQPNAFVYNTLDVGEILILHPDEYTIRTSTALQYCHNSASVGDSIVILGYPGIGSQTDITATEGIISGRDGNFYITSAKVERGNSGGAAILVKDNCYLGIPTFAISGSIESLARILDIKVILNQ